jgi:protein-L-isoaspartate O-methyltransferase
MAQMLEDLKLRRGLKVLEVGAGTGYNAALIAHVVGPELVTSIDVNLEVLSEAWDHLRSYPERGVRLLHGDGRSGYRPSAPYDRIIVTAATPDLEPAWLAELRSGGLLVAPLELAPGLAFVVRGRATGGQFDGRLCRAAYFMPLRAAENEDDGELSVPPADIETLSVPAPWSAWLERKRLRSSLAGIAPAFAFFAFLHRFRVSHQAAFGNGAIFGIGEGAERCWLGSPQWRCASAGARDLALDLWREFLNLGAPRPIEYRVHFAPFDLPEVPGTFSRLGPKFAQRWELPSPRERLAWP